MEFLKAILGDKYPEFEAAVNAYNALPENKEKQIKLANLGTGEYVGIGKYNALVAERDGIQEKLTTAEGTITTLKKDNKDNETLQGTIKQHEQTIQKLQDDAANTTKTYALKEQLSKAGVLDPDYLIYKQGGLEKFNFDKEGKPIGIEDILKPMKEDKAMAYLFQAGKNGTEYNPAGGGSYTGKNPFAKESFNLTEQGKLFKENPAQAKELAAAAGVTI